MGSWQRLHDSNTFKIHKSEINVWNRCSFCSKHYQKSFAEESSVDFCCNKELFPNVCFFLILFLNHHLINLSVQNACVAYSLGSNEQCSHDHCKTHAHYHVLHSAYITATEVHSDSLIKYTEEFHSHSLTNFYITLTNFWLK